MEFAVPSPAKPPALRADDSCLNTNYSGGKIMLSYLYVALGGAIGSVARYWLSGLIASSKFFGQSFPWGTLVVNITGCFIIGLFNSLTVAEGRVAASPDLRTFFMIGICGGYTTFSSFSLQTLTLAEEGEWLYAGGNVLLSVVLCLLGVWLGHLLAVSLNSPR
jgi:CrcB protein